MVIIVFLIVCYRKTRVMFHLLLLICSSLVLGNPCLQKNISLSRGKVCRQIFKFDSISRVKTFWTDTYCLQKYPVSRGIPQVYSRSRGLRSTPPSSKFDCQNIECICNFISGSFSDLKEVNFSGGVFLNGVCKMPDGGTYTKSFRKEFRMLSDAERSLLVLVKVITGRLLGTPKRSGLFNQMFTICYPLYTETPIHLWGHILALIFVHGIEKC